MFGGKKCWQVKIVSKLYTEVHVSITNAYNTIRQYQNKLFKRNQIKYRKYEMKKTPNKTIIPEIDPK